MQFSTTKTSRVGYLALAAAFGLMAAATSYADGKGDYYIQEAEKLFYSTTTNARQAGQAGANDVISTDSSAVVNNPAGVGVNQGGDLSVSYGRNEISGNEVSDYAEVEDESNMGQVLVSVPLVPTLDGSPEYGSVGFGWTGTDSNSDDAVDTDTESNQVHGAYGIDLGEGLSVGYGLTWFDNQQTTVVSDFEQTNGFRHTFGAQLVDGDVTLGATFFFANGEYDLEGLNPDLSVSTGTSDYTEHGFEVGAGYKVDDATTVSSAVNYQNFDVDGEFIGGPEDTFVGGNEGGAFFAIKLGVEQKIDEMFTARLGYRYLGRDQYFFGREDLRDLNGSAKTNAYSAGLGVAFATGMHYFPKVNLDYAAEYREIAYGDWQQTVTLSFPFNLCEPS